MAEGTKWAKVNSDYFDCIDSPEKAYILGLLAADGNVYVRYGEYGISLRLSKKDYQAVEFVRDRLVPMARIWHYTNKERYIGNRVIKPSSMCGVRFCSKHIVKTLASYGVIPDKTGGFEFPEKLFEEYQVSFILGYFDGDGSAGIYDGKPKWQIYSSNWWFLNRVRQIIYYNTGIIGSVNHNRENWVLLIGGRNALVVDEWLHSCGLGLSRKFIAKRG